jgi:3-dehydroquinate dehydratase
MKKIVVFLSMLIAMSGISPANAGDSNKDLPPTIAIIDTAFDASVFADSVIEEVCITAGGGCNNGTGFELGYGSSGANILVKSRDLENWTHGNLMAKTILESNPNAKLLLVRNAKIYGNAILPGTEKDFSVALSWLASNAELYNVVAVSFSRGSHSYVSSNKKASSLAGSIKIYESMILRLKSKNSNPRIIAPLEKTLNNFKSRLASLPMAVCPNTNDIKNKIVVLQDLEIATIVATGNDADKVYVDYPACIEEAVSVTAHNGANIVHVGNVSSTTDFASQATTTSEATAKLAGLWSLVYDGSYESTYNVLKNSGIKSGNTVLVPNSF